MAQRPFVFLDDDPTGVQAVADVPVVLRWRDPALGRLLDSGTRAIHVLTNSRALASPDAETTVFDAAAAVTEAAPDAPILLRGDSTLRGHLVEEYRAVWRARAFDQPPVLLLVPALPAAGRVTRDGVHYLVSDGGQIPLSDTEYARDGDFSYRSSRLIEWADERSGGLLAAARGVEVPRQTLRRDGPDAVVAALQAAAQHHAPAVCAPDADSLEDLQVIADGFRGALNHDVPVIVRCAPAFAGVLAGTLATGEVKAPRVRRGVLIVCGSYVENTTIQLRYVFEQRGLAPIECDPVRLAAESEDRAAGAEVRRIGEAATAALQRDRVALVATPRVRPTQTQNLRSGLQIATHLARVATVVGAAADVIIAKGGITSAVTLSVGLGAAEALAVGPVMPGVALWRPRLEHPVSYLVVPGNVGAPSLLDDLLTRIGV